MLTITLGIFSVNVSDAIVNAAVRLQVLPIDKIILKVKQSVVKSVLLLCVVGILSTKL